MSRLLSFGILIVSWSIVNGEESIHSSLQRLYNAFPTATDLKSVIDGIDDENRTTHLQIDLKVLGRGFHREIFYTLRGIPLKASRVFLFQELKEDVFVDPHELDRLKVPMGQYLETQVVGPVDVESPTPSSKPTLLIIKGSFDESRQELFIKIPFNLRYPNPLRSDQNQMCEDVDSDRSSDGIYQCVELDPPMAFLKTDDRSKYLAFSLVDFKAKMNVPAGNLDHIPIVFWGSGLLLLSSLGLVIYVVLFCFKNAGRDLKSD